MSPTEQIKELIRRIHNQASSLEVEAGIRSLVSQHPIEELIQTYSGISTQYVPKEALCQLSLSADMASSQSLARTLEAASLEALQSRYEGLAELVAFIQEAEPSDLEVRVAAFTKLLQIGVTIDEIETQHAGA